MKRCWLVILAFLTLTCSCSLDHEAERLQTTLNKQMEQANTIAQDLSQQLQNEVPIDSIWASIDKQSNILIYIFDFHGLAFWSDNWLAGEDIVLMRYNRWYYKQFSNAHAVYCWTWAGKYNILTIIPIKYAYAFENEQLHNTYIPPFRLNEKTHISRERQQDEHIAIKGLNDEYLFSVCQNDDHEIAPKTSTSLLETISYQSLLQENERQETDSPWYAERLFLFLDIFILLILLIVLIVALIRFKGLKKMPIGRKLSYVTLTLLLIFTVYIFTASTVYVQKQYQERQRNELTNQTRYIQKALQELYFWKVTLTPQNTQGLNVYLRDLALTYHTDIHVYDSNGDLVGTSSPSLFDNGLISKHLTTKAFFAKDENLLLEERIGDVEYLCSYAPLLNGSYLQIGYIAIPRFLAQEELIHESNDFASQLFPPILIILALAIFLSFYLSRTVTKPIRRLTHNMQNFHIGSPNNHLQYNYDDEIGQLVEQYNKMVDELEHSTERLALSERETAWRTMARQIAHEINNSLTPMKLTLQHLRRTKQKGDTERFDENFDKYTTVIIDQIDTLSSIAQSFSNFAKMPVVVTKEVDVAQKLFSTITLFRNNQEHIKLRYIGAEYGVKALTDDEQINQVFSNLIKNAIQAIENHADADIIVMLKDLPEEVEISVSDNGPGIPEEIRDKVFRPNFTTKSTGMGLGLAISKNIVEASQGTISFETSPKGTTFFVKLRK